MAYNSDYNDDANVLVYDLRQKYAEIVGGILEEIARARSEERFKDWFNWLRNLRVEINQKFNNKEREEYKEVLDRVINSLNKSSAAYLGQNSDPKEIEKVKLALEDLDLWLRDKMEKHKMFGSKGEPEVL